MRNSNGEHTTAAVTIPGTPQGTIHLDQVPAMSIGDLLRILTKRKWLILICVVACFLLSLLYVHIKTPIYEATANIQIDPSRMGSLGLSDLISLTAGGGSDQVATEIEILKSDSVVMTTLAALSPEYQHQFAGPNVDLNNLENLEPHQRDAILGRFKSRLKCKHIEGTQIVQITFRNSNSKLATAVVNQLVTSYMLSNFQSRYSSVTQVSKWLSDQMSDLKGRASQAQKKLADFQEQNNILGTDASDNTTVDRLKLLNDQLTTAQADRITKEARFRVAASGDPQLLATLAPDTTLQSLQSQQADLYAQYAQLSTKFGNGYPPLVDLKEQIAKIKNQIAQEVRTVTDRLAEDYHAASEAESMLRNQYQEQGTKAYALNRKVAEYALLKDEGESSRDLFDMLQYKLQQAGVDAGLNSVNTMIIDHAKVPSTPVEPQKTLILAIGACLGLVTGTSIAFLREAIENNVENATQVESLLSLPTLAVVPQYNRQELLDIQSTANDSADPLAKLPHVVTVRRPLSRAAESYRTLRNSVLLSSLDRPAKTILFTSSLPAEGKSTTALNFAIVLAQKGARVLLIDADLRRPSLYRLLGVSNSKGLSSLLLDEESNGAIITPIHSLPTLDFIPSGPKVPSPSEVLSSMRFHEHLERWESQYDYLIIDSAPVLSVSDSIPVATWADSVLIVARYAVTPIKALMRTRSILLRVNAKIHGVILNGVSETSEEYYYYGRYSDAYYN